ncbi:MAG: CusA/CzcA family heavy metal efflux RND transporter, partial [Alphaproteobacteria bacterium]|nr:CusA/CzcA family heavy metal efflux RND transporter [Alphaproteobacteria bacterium]
VLLEDVAEVEYGYAPRFGALTYNDQGETVGAVVLMLKGENSKKVLKLIKKKIEIINKSLPEGLKVEPFLDRTKMVNNSINTVKINLMEGALIVIFVLVLLLGNLRAGLIVAIIIPLSLLFAIIMMTIFGISGNLMSLGALDFGLIIDGAVIIVEGVLHHIYQYKKETNLPYLTRPEMNGLVIETSGKMMKSTLFGQTIILVVYFPIFMLQGIEGKLFKPMAITVIFALLGSFILTLTLIPMLAANFLKPDGNSGNNISNRFFEFLSNKFAIALRYVLNHAKRFVLIVVVLFLYAMYIFNTLGGEFIPILEEGDFAIELRILPGSNLNTTIESCEKVSHALLENFPEVIKIVSKIGTSEIPTDPMPLEAADVIVILKDKSEWVSAHSYNELADKMQAVIKKFPGINTNFQYPVQMRFNELMTGSKQDIVCKIYGDNFDSLIKLADKIGNIVKTVKGPQDIYIEALNKSPQVVIKYNRNALSFYNLSIEEANKIIKTSFAGEKAGIIFEGEKRFDLVVRLEDRQRANINNLNNLNIVTSQGNQIPLSVIADISIINSPSIIQRENAYRWVSVAFNVRNRDVQSTVNELKQKIESEHKFPTGYFVKYGGAFENLNKAKDRLYLALPVSLIFILLLLYFAFNSIRNGLIVLITIPLSTIGGILYLAYRDMPFSISAGIGFIALFGICVLNGIVLITEYNNLKKVKFSNIQEIIIEATKSRLRPIILTASVAALGFLPMAFSENPGSEVQRPLGTVVIGGLLFSTFLSLFIIPIAYQFFEKLHLKKYHKNTTINKAMPIIMLFVFGNTMYSGFSQKPIQLDDALNLGIKNSLISKLKDAERQQIIQKIKSSKPIPYTNIKYEFGDLNSSLFDNKFEINQEFKIGNYYKNNKHILQTELQIFESNKAITTLELKKEITSVFYKILICQKKIDALANYKLELDKLNDKIILNQKIGEDNQILKLETENKIIEFNHFLNAIHNEKRQYSTLLNFLLQTDSVEPVADSILFFQSNNYPLPSQNPNLILLENEKKLATLNRIQEQKTLFPTINIGTIAQTFRGYDAASQDHVYNRYSNYFFSFNVQLAVPIFYKTQTNNIKVAKLYENTLQVKYALEKERLKVLYDKNQSILNATYSSILNYKNKVLPNAYKLNQLYAELYLKGEINLIIYLEKFSLYLQENFHLFDLIDSYNQLSIENYFLNEKQ